MDEDPIEFVRVSLTTASTTSRAVTAQVLAAGAEGQEAGDAESFDDSEAPQPLGLLARPVVTQHTEAIGVRRGDEMVLLCILDKSRNAQAVEEGETRLYGAGVNNQTTVIRILPGGAIEITSANNGNVTVNANGTGEVRLNGSALRIAADTDPVDLGSWTHVPASGAGVTPCSLTYTPPGGSPTPIGTATAVEGKVEVTSTRRVKVEA